MIYALIGGLIVLAAGVVALRRFGKGTAFKNVVEHILASATNSFSNSVSHNSLPTLAPDTAPVAGNANPSKLEIGGREGTKLHLSTLLATIEDLTDQSHDLGADSIADELDAVKSKLAIWAARVEKNAFMARMAIWWHNSTVAKLSSQLEQLEKNRTAIKGNVDAATSALTSLEDGLELFIIEKTQAGTKIVIPADLGVAQADVDAHKQALEVLKRQVGSGDWRQARDELPQWSQVQTQLLSRIEAGKSACEALRRRYEALKGLTSARLSQGESLGLTKDNAAKTVVDNVALMLTKPPVDVDEFEAAVNALQALITAAQQARVA